MANNDALKRYLEVGMALSQALGERAEVLVKDLRRTGEQQRDQVDELFERSLRGTESLLALLRREISAQVTEVISDLGLATRADLQALEARLRAEMAESRVPTRRRSPAAAGPASGAPGGRSRGRAAPSAAATKATSAARPAKKAATAASTKAGPSPTKKAAGTKAAPTPRRRSGA